MNSGRKNKRTPGLPKGYPSGLLLEALKLLAESGAQYLLIGGIACNLHGLSENTKDIDVLIPRNLQNTKKILDSLAGLTCGIAKEILAEEVIEKPFTIIGDLPRVDLLLVAGKINFEKAYPNKVVKTIDGIKVPFVSLEDLIKSKQTRRPKDKMTIKELKDLKKL